LSIDIANTSVVVNHDMGAEDTGSIGNDATMDSTAAAVTGKRKRSEPIVAERNPPSKVDVEMVRKRKKAAVAEISRDLLEVLKEYDPFYPRTCVGIV
jgi:hypothetical protein